MGLGQDFRIRRAIALLLALAGACSTPESLAEQQPTARPDEPATTREADPMLDLGYVLRSHVDEPWGLYLEFPLRVGLTDFDLDESPTLDNVATVAVVPTAEFVVPLNERWTAMPFVGLGGAWQTGAQELIGGNEFIGLLNGGVRFTRWQHFGDRHWFGLMGRVRYDAALTARDGLLGDWGSLDGALELRRDFGEASDAPRFQGGVYLLGTHFWQPIELDITGITPPTVDDQIEIGISLGSTRPARVLGIALPRVFIGVVAGDELSGIRVRFGRL